MEGQKADCGSLDEQPTLLVDTPRSSSPRDECPSLRGSSTRELVMEIAGNGQRIDGTCLQLDDERPKQR